MKAWVEANRASEAPFDIVVEGTTKNSRDTAQVREWAGAGATWWIEAMWMKDEAAALERLRQGPPKF